MSVVFWHDFDAETRSRPTIYVRVFELGDNAEWDSRAQTWRNYARSHTCNFTVGSATAGTQTPTPNSMHDVGSQTQSQGGADNGYSIPNPADPWADDVFIRGVPQLDAGSQTEMEFGGTQLLIDLVNTIPRSVILSPLQLELFVPAPATGTIAIPNSATVETQVVPTDVDLESLSDLAVFHECSVQTAVTQNCQFAPAPSRTVAEQEEDEMFRAFLTSVADACPRNAPSGASSSGGPLNWLNSSA